MNDVYFRDTCRLCDGRNLRLLFSLVPTPPGNHFVGAERLDEEQKCYPLDLYFCEDCAHVQLGHVVLPTVLYQNHYSYVSGTSPVFLRHLKESAYDIVSEYHPRDGGLVVDIGSNDGSALRFFREQGFRVLGVDPAIEIAKRANEAAIETLCEFFGRNVAEKYEPLYGPAALIISHNTLAHIDDLRAVVESARRWLADDGLFVVEVGYLLDVFQKMWFDTIYHEHLDFHSVSPLVAFFDRMGMEIIDVRRTSAQGGSIRVVLQKQGGKYPIKRAVQEIVLLERDAGLHNAESFVQYAQQINSVKVGLTELVGELKRQGKRIAAFGAPTKATTLLYHFGLGWALDFLVDENPLKQHMYSPGLHLPVYPAEAIYEKRPDCLLILAWNFADDIMQRHGQYRDMGGRFILPMPVARIVA